MLAAGGCEEVRAAAPAPPPVRHDACSKPSHSIAPHRLPRADAGERVRKIRYATSLRTENIAAAKCRGAGVRRYAFPKSKDVIQPGGMIGDNFLPLPILSQARLSWRVNSTRCFVIG